MTPDKFISLLRKEANICKNFLETDSQDWIVKGFIDIDKNVYTITNPIILHLYDNADF